MSSPNIAVINIDTFRSWQTGKRPFQLLDVRSATEFASGHIPGAINMPLEQIESRAADLDPSASTVLVCQAGTRARVAADLLAPFRPELFVLLPGTASWIADGLPVIRSVASRWALERQVRLIAGLLVLLGVIFGLLVTPWAFGLSAFVGCGLTFAGITNLCPMGELLIRLPWNRTRRATGTALHATSGVSCPCELPK